MCAAEYSAVSGGKCASAYTGAGQVAFWLLISPEGEQPFQTGGQTLESGFCYVSIRSWVASVGVIARLIGLQPKDVAMIRGYWRVSSLRW